MTDVQTLEKWMLEAEGENLEFKASRGPSTFPHLTRAPIMSKFSVHLSDNMSLMTYDWRLFCDQSLGFSSIPSVRLSPISFHNYAIQFDNCENDLHDYKDRLDESQFCRDTSDPWRTQRYQPANSR